MSLEKTLARVEQDIAAGNFGKARDRLHGLLAARPNDLELRRRLGGVYRELQYPAMAGRYWYLEEDKSPEMEAAAREFEKACGSNPVLILQALKFKGELESVERLFARETLLTLQRRAKAEHGYNFKFGDAASEEGAAPVRTSFSERLFTVGCVVSILTALTLMAVGLVVVLHKVFG
jgi:hypothetical protein